MASLLEFPPLFQETAQRIRDRMDADANAGLAADDARWVDTREGTFYFDVTQVALLEIARLWDTLSVEVPASGIPLYAWGAYLDAHAGLFGLVRKPAVRATTTVRFIGEPDALVASGTLVSTTPPDEATPSVEFKTTEAGTTGAQLGTPGPVTATPGSGGSLAAGTYLYVVTALNGFGETLGSIEASATVGASGEVVLDWPDVTDATSYAVYRGIAAGGPYYRIATPSSSGYTDTGAATGSANPPDANTTAGVDLTAEAIDAGMSGNVGTGAITNLDSANALITSVANTAPGVGGSEVEADAALLVRIQVSFRGQGAGNINDYVRWSLDEAGVARVFVNPEGAGSVQVVVMADANGDPVASTVVASLQNRLDPVAGQGKGQAPVGATVTVETSTVVPITAAATITFKTGYNLDGTGGLIASRDRLVQALQGYIDALDVGETVVYDHVKAQFFTVPGVYSVSGVTVNGGTSDVTVSTSPAEVAQLVLPPTLAQT